MTGPAVLLENGQVIDGLGHAPRIGSVLFDEASCASGP